MLEINLLKVENPSCLWGRFVKGPGIEAVENKKEYDDLQMKMNLFYHEVNLHVQKIKLSTIESGQVCVVYWSALRSWCRAIVESLFLGTVGTQAMCFLVDHGERVIVNSDEIRALLDTFLQLPFWVRKFQLAGVHPMTLHVSGDCLEKDVMKIGNVHCVSFQILMRNKYAGPSVAESYCWPAVARGCDTVLISHSGDQPLTYIPPFLAHMQLSSVFSALSARTGPIAVILCPGWEKAQTVIDLLEESQTFQVLHPMVILLGLGKDEAKTVKIKNDCQVVVTTPFSLVRLLRLHCFLFLRLCHLALDEVDLLFSRAPDEMTIILQHFQRVTASEERVSCPRQIIAVGKRWSRPLEGLLLNHMSNPTVVVTVMEEAALYGNVHQIILLCLDCTKISVLLGALDFTPDVAQKTLVITNSAEEAENVFKAVSNTSAFSLKVHEELTYQFDFVTEQWKKPIGPGTHVILVTTNECMKSLGICDATCVVHYGFPSSPKLFGSRLFCMSQNFQNLSDKRAAESTSHPAKSVLLLSERNARHVTGVLRYLKRTEASLPPELLHFAQGVLRAKEEQKSDKPLCRYLKSFGFCRSVQLRYHRCNIVLPLFIKTASVYYGRIVSKKEDRYESLAAAMTTYYAAEKLGAKEVLEGGLYGVQEDEVYHRVRVTSVPDKGEWMFCSVRALFLDEGREQEVKSHQLLQLPAQFHTLPPQALEIIVCRAMPIDAEVKWNPKVTRAISQKIKGLQHQAKVVLCLGNTVFVDPMVRMTRLPGLKTFINEYNVHAEILSTGMGTSNPQHLDLLNELCQWAGPGASLSRSAPDGPESLCSCTPASDERCLYIPVPALAQATGGPISSSS
uniref:RNA helicase n=1 Tax=Oncorhynchus mykiss TaxID=8022 RepID=A0A8C7VDQ9_ONCMY